MILPVVSCCSESASERFLFSESPFGGRLLSFVQEEIRLAGIHQGCRALALSCYHEVLASAGLQSCLTDPASIDFVDPVSAVSVAVGVACTTVQSPEWILLVAPGVGPVVTSRITPLLDIISAGTDANMLVSALPVPPNANPAWLKAVPTEGVVGNSVTLDAFDENIDFKFETDPGVTVTAPRGSQWLPEYYYFDGAVAAVRCTSEHDGFRGDNCHFVASCVDENAPLLYRLPYFQLSPTYSPDWQVSESDVPKLLSRRKGSAGGEIQPGIMECVNA